MLYICEKRSRCENEYCVDKSDIQPSFTHVNFTYLQYLMVWGTTGSLYLLIFSNQSQLSGSQLPYHRSSLLLHCLLFHQLYPAIHCFGHVHLNVLSSVIGIALLYGLNYASIVKFKAHFMSL